MSGVSKDLNKINAEKNFRVMIRYFFLETESVKSMQKRVQNHTSWMKLRKPEGERDG